MSEERQFGNPAARPYNETRQTKIFVGGLAWETKKETMRRYFEQFGDIVEAVVITDKNTGRSKGYGFVTFKDPGAAVRACQIPSPVIDGRRANCNLASLGAHKASSPLLIHGTGRLRSGAGLMAPSSIYGSSPHFVHHPTSQLPFPYTGYRLPGYSQEAMYHHLNYSNLYGSQQFSPYLSPFGSPGVFHNVYPPFYLQFPQSSNQVHGYGIQYSPAVQYPFLPQQFTSPPPPLLSLPNLSASDRVAASFAPAAEVKTSTTTDIVTARTVSGQNQSS